MNTFSKKLIITLLIIFSSIFTFTACTLGMRPEFKQAMDSYESFIDEYCEFMIEYREENESLNLLDDYLEYVDKYAEAVENFEKVGDEELNTAEKNYYAKVLSRTSKKLLDLNNG